MKIENLRSQIGGIRLRAALRRDESAEDSGGLAAPEPWRRRVNSKRANFDLFGSGAFGNRLRQWGSYEEWVAGGCFTPVTMRYRGTSGGGWCRYDVPLGEVSREMECWQAQGAQRERIFFNESAPNGKAILQGELVAAEWCGYALHYSTVAAPMRDALRVEPRNHCGPGALLILKRVMSPNSYSDLRDVLDMWPGAAVELSVFSRFVGEGSRRNTIIWEVRHY